VRLLVGATVPQAAVQVTPFESLVVAVTVLSVVLTSTFAVAGLTVTVMVLELPHATRAAIMVKLTRRRSDLRNVIGHLR
jgi:hypothetical protein